MIDRLGLEGNQLLVDDGVLGIGARTAKSAGVVNFITNLGSGNFTG